MEKISIKYSLPSNKSLNVQKYNLILEWLPFHSMKQVLLFITNIYTFHRNIRLLLLLMCHMCMSRVGDGRMQFFYIGWAEFLGIQNLHFDSRVFSFFFFFLGGGSENLGMK